MTTRPAYGSVVAAARPAVILLVEDDPADQELTRRALAEGRIANELIIVDDGEQAVDYLLRQGPYANPATSPRPDLVLLDLNLPRLDGRQVLQRIRADPRVDKLPVVVLTTSKQEQDILHSYALAANSYIVKPVDVDQFMQVIRSLEEYWFAIVVLPPEEP